jgi:5-methylcytosine-specific restriction endonuclease McrA
MLLVVFAASSQHAISRYMEVWKSIPGYEGAYSASNLGRIRSDQRKVRHPRGGTTLRPAKIRKPVPNQFGRLCLSLSVKGVVTRVQVHRLVAAAFHGPCPEGMECCHNNGDSSDNRPENLRWDTRVNNHADKIEHGTTLRGMRGSNRKLTIQQVEEIRADNRYHHIIAKEYGISKSQVGRIRAGTRWV